MLWKSLTGRRQRRGVMWGIQAKASVRRLGQDVPIVGLGVTFGRVAYNPEGKQ